MRVEDVTADAIERWIAGFEGSVRSRNKLLIQLHGILGRAKKVYGLAGNAGGEVEKFQQRASGDIQVFSPEEAGVRGEQLTNELASHRGLGPLRRLQWLT